MLLCYDTTICSRYDLPYPSIQYQYCTLQDVMHGKPNLTFFCSLTNCAAIIFAVAIILIFMTPDHKNSKRFLTLTSAGNYNIYNGRYEFQVWDDKNVVISFNNRLWLDPQLKPISSFEKKQRGSMPHRRKNIITINPSPLYQCIAFGGVVGIKRK